LSNDFNTDPKCLRDRVFYPVIFIPNFEPMLRNGLSDGCIREFVCRIRKEKYEPKLGRLNWFRFRYGYCGSKWLNTKVNV
jgi:hypothetical protein